MSLPCISAIIPVYNSERYLSDMFDSIIEQTFDNYELILINDGSVDKSDEIIKKYKSVFQNKMIVIEENNHGQSYARNKGIEIARGEYIAFIDSDDIIDKYYFEYLLNNSDNKDADIVICGYEKFKESLTNIIYKRIPNQWAVNMNNETTYVFHYSPCGKIFRASFLKKYHIKFSEGEQLEDGPFNIWAGILSSKTNCIDYVGYKYRVYDTSTMGNIRIGKPKQELPYKAIEEVIINVKKRKHDKDMFEYAIMKELAGLCTNMCNNIDREKRKELCNYCDRILKTYFPNCINNKYLSLSLMKNINMVHNLAVKIFIFAYKHNCLYYFSSIVSKVL